MTFENKYVEKHDAHYSRYIASWIKSGGDFKCGYRKGGILGTTFAKWLKTLGMSDSEVYDIWNLATCGKFEFESNAKNFLKGLES